MNTIHHHIKEGTQNTKLTGGDSIKTVVATVSSWQTCSVYCPMYKDCYGKKGYHIRLHADKVTRGERGTEWAQYIEELETIRNKSFVRFSVTGDLPSVSYETKDRQLSKKKVEEMRAALERTNSRGYTYTHLHCDKKHGAKNLEAVKELSREGFVINVSVEDREKAKRLKKDHFDVALIDSELFEKAREGKAKGYFACPAQYKNEEGIKGRCIDCKECSNWNRENITVFKLDK